MTLAIDTRDLTCTYGGTTALDDVSLHLPAGTLCGLIGRNGSGKTTLLETIAAFRRPTRGEVRVGGVDPFEHAGLMAATCLVRETADVEADGSIRDALWMVGGLRPHWDEEYAQHLLDRFGLDPKRKVKALSLGQRSSVGIVIGLASRAPLTLFDESYLGLDAVGRKVFYEELLADYLRSPRTVVVSTHLIGEIAPLLDHVVVLERGRLSLHEDVETLRSRGVTLTGPAEAVDRLAERATVLESRRLGPTSQVTLYGTLDDTARAAAAASGVEVGPVALADLLVHLTAIDAEVVGSDAAAGPSATTTTEARP